MVKERDKNRETKDAKPYSCSWNNILQKNICCDKIYEVTLNSEIVFSQNQEFSPSLF